MSPEGGGGEAILENGGVWEEIPSVMLEFEVWGWWNLGLLLPRQGSRGYFIEQESLCK